MRSFLKALIVATLTLLPGLAVAVPHLTIDLDSGRVLSQKQAFDAWHPASLTKLMTAYVVFEAIERGDLTAASPVRMSKRATREPPSKMGYRVGTTITLEDALKLLIVKSANDVSVAIAETVSGSVENFANAMNREAAQLGMTDSRFVNPHGLHNARQYTTARDLAVLLQALHQRHKRYASYFEAPGVLAQKRTKKGKVIDRVYYSYNLLLERYRGADGFKTGFVCASGYNFAGSATRGGRRIAAIVLGRESQTDRAVSAAKLLTDAFQKPVSDGILLSDLKKPENARSTPRNMRPIMCSPEAREKRYEPGAGLAVIDSPWLEKRKKAKITLRTTLQKDAPRQRRVPIPTPRPEYQLPAPIDGVIASASRIPLPRFRPTTASN